MKDKRRISFADARAPAECVRDLRTTRFSPDLTIASTSTFAPGLRSRTISTSLPTLSRKTESGLSVAPVRRPSRFREDESSEEPADHVED